ncbi:MAG: GNAT family N-acetyltransferase [Desulfurococcales archaeon ex4484_58]|nr:MAG: GNAT family N-acetyltransferase [Desulfurococcales archaeon ex4484_58]
MYGEVLIRKASLEDVWGIVDVYCSGVEKWYRLVGGRKVESSYEELSIVERWSHGGPWMSVESCAVHLNYVLVNDQYPLVAVVDDKIVGELELYIGYGDELLGRHGYIDVLEVHRSYRRRGIGRALVEKAVEIAGDNGCETVAVWPDPNAIGFYEKIGLDKIAYRVKYVKLDITKTKPLKPDQLDIRDFPENYGMLEKWFFISPRIETSYIAWLKSRWDYAIEQEILRSFEATMNNEVALIIEEIWGEKNEANLYLWIKDKNLLDQALELSMGIAKHLGFNSLRLLASREIYEKQIEKYKHQILQDYIVLYREIK